MSDEITVAEANFENGSPTVEFDRIYRCFRDRGNGLLFRLVNESKKQWAFYNDTADTVMRVTAKFGPGTDIKTLRRARQEMIPQDGGEPGPWEQIVTVSVEPFRTEMFIEGDVNGFEMDFQSEAVPSNDVQFENRRRELPQYDQVYKCFKNDGNGLFFRLVNEKENRWYFYNDTRDFIMTATVSFTDRSSVTPIGNTTEVPVAEDDTNEVAYRIVVEPGKAEPFIEGAPTGYRQAFSADPIEEDRIEAGEVQYENGSPNPDVVDANSCKVYKCFKNNGNGLLFRYVDEQNGIWAFYNDTVDYVMKPKVRFFQSPDIKPAAGAEVSEDPEDPEAIVVTMEIPPLETLLFIEGCPSRHEVSVTAESVNRTAPEEQPNYESGEPDRSIIDYDLVYRCFKDKPSARLFRLVDSKNNCWGFYNDNTDTQFTARVAFDAEDKVRAMGDTQVDKDPDMGMTYVVDIPPQQTVAFVYGDIHSFRSQFSGRRVAPAA